MHPKPYIVLCVLTVGENQVLYSDMQCLKIPEKYVLLQNVDSYSIIIVLTEL
jgi:hypothetical protein